MQPRRGEKGETAANCWTSGSLLHATETGERDDGGKASDGAGWWRLIRRAVDGVRPSGREGEGEGSPERRGKGRGGHRMERERERVRERESQGERERKENEGGDMQMMVRLHGEVQGVECGFC